MKIYPDFSPTYLYIKQHVITGKLYFGKTIGDPVKYLGSGNHWVNHIKKYGKEFIETPWYCLFTDKEELTKFALMFSEQHNIVKSDLWLNLKFEDDLDGVTPGSKQSIETRQKLSDYRKTTRMSEVTKLKIRLKLTGRTVSSTALENMKASFTPIRHAQISQRCKGAGNSRALNWLIEDENGNIEQIRALKNWCALRGIKYASLIYTSKSKYGKFYHGFKVRRVDHV